MREEVEWNVIPAALLLRRFIVGPFLVDANQNENRKSYCFEK